MGKANIQDMLDEMVKKYKESNQITTYCGVPLTEFTQEELMALIREREKFYNWMTKV